MKRIILIFTVFITLLLFSAQYSFAAMLTFSLGGEVYWNVLGINEDSLEVKKIADNLNIGAGNIVSLVNDNGKVLLSYGEKQMDITGYGENIVEIEQKEPPNSLFIKSSEDGFSLIQRGIEVSTTFPIKVNTPRNRLSVETATGEHYLTILPYDAVNLVLKTNIISNLTDALLVEKEQGGLIYEVNGYKEIVLFNIFLIQIPIKAEISVATGSVVKVEQPLWYSIMDFMLV